MSGKVVCFGEILMRLSPPGHVRLQSTRQLEIQIGGAEANVATALSGFGISTSMASTVPDNPLGHMVLAELASRGIDNRFVQHGPGRLGIYFLETGAVQRPSKITYDRADSSFAQADTDTYDWSAILDGASILHLSGITPAVSKQTAEAAWDAVSAAAEKGVKVSFDGNYRRALWEEWSGDGPMILRRLIEHSSIAFINERDLGLIFGRDFDSRDSAVAYAFEAFPELETIAATVRTQSSVANQSLQGQLFRRDATWTSHTHDMVGVIDRIGGGDAFAAGVLCGLLDGLAPQETIEFGVAASVQKHSIPGDALIASKEEIEQLLKPGGLDVHR